MRQLWGVEKTLLLTYSSVSLTSDASFPENVEKDMETPAGSSPKT